MITICEWNVSTRALYQNKHHTENHRASNTNTTKNRGSTHVLCTRTNTTQKTTDPATRTPLKTGGQLTCFVPEQTPHRKPQIQQHEHHKKPGVNSRDLYQNKHHTENHRSSNTNTTKNGGQLTYFVPEQTPNRKPQNQQKEHHQTNKQTKYRHLRI
jgi:hypothetical protein